MQTEESSTIEMKKLPFSISNILNDSLAASSQDTIKNTSKKSNANYAKKKCAKSNVKLENLEKKSCNNDKIDAAKRNKQSGELKKSDDIDDEVDDESDVDKEDEYDSNSDDNETDNQDETLETSQNNLSENNSEDTSSHSSKTNQLNDDVVTTSQTKLFLDSYLNNFYQNASAEEPFNVHQLENNKNLLKLFLSTQSASIYNSLLANWLNNYKCASNIESSSSVASHESASFLDTKAPNIYQKRVGHPYQNRNPPKRKKPRTSFNRPQIVELEKRFMKQKYLASSERSTLAKLLKMTDAQVKTWFQNRRTKWRRQNAEEKEAERQAATKIMQSLKQQTLSQSVPNLTNRETVSSEFGQETKQAKIVNGGALDKQQIITSIFQNSSLLAINNNFSAQNMNSQDPLNKLMMMEKAYNNDKNS